MKPVGRKHSILVFSKQIIALIAMLRLRDCVLDVTIYIHQDQKSNALKISTLNVVLCIVL